LVLRDVFSQVRALGVRDQVGRQLRPDMEPGEFERETESIEHVPAAAGEQRRRDLRHLDERAPRIGDLEELRYDGGLPADRAGDELYRIRRGVLAHAGTARHTWSMDQGRSNRQLGGRHAAGWDDWAAVVALTSRAYRRPPRRSTSPLETTLRSCWVRFCAAILSSRRSARLSAVVRPVVFLWRVVMRSTLPRLSCAITTFRYRRHDFI